MINNKKLTLMFAMGICIGSLAMWSYMFIVFIMGYTMTFLEPHIITALMELIIALICIPIIFNSFKERILTNE